MIIYERFKTKLVREMHRATGSRTDKRELIALIRNLHAITSGYSNGIVLMATLHILGTLAKDLESVLPPEVNARELLSDIFQDLAPEKEKEKE